MQTSQRPAASASASVIATVTPLPAASPSALMTQRSPKSSRQASAPAFDLRGTFDGPLVASGVIYGPTGRVATRRSDG